MKKFVLVSLLLLGGSGLAESLAQIPPFISDSTTVSVMTMGPSQVELYTAFGHSAFRVLDHKTGIDLVFNYGIFSFNQPNFYLNFARGKLLYKLGVNRYEDFKEAYIEENRSIVEQNLNLTVSEKHQLYAFLVENNKPENRDYYYNYIYDNCATKIRDVLETVFKDRITFDYSYVTEDLTFRQLMDMNLGQQPWGDLGIDICLGTGIDKVATGYQYMYLPEYIQKAFAGATLQRSNGKVPLVNATEVVFMPTEEGESQASLVTPTIVFVLVFMLVGFSTQQEWKAGKRRKWLDFTLFFVVGVVGILLLFLWFATDHISQYNFNLLWAFPLHAFVAFYAFKNSPPNWLSTYLLSAAVLLALVIVSWSFLPQMLHLALVPIMLTLGLRAIFWRKSAFRAS
ncbi:MAG: DUF4105 domain-containing protein [Imperialibacter sp.]|uniref:lipoprotein N-acyltransferase Lnb domain-containing protein n=1 Tax=Imperialibacter sp. TaxID=2038411 RepID=UPI0032ECCF23